MPQELNISLRSIEQFQQLILKWFTSFGRSFSWRADTLSQYQYVIAEILLQRTKAENVARVFDQFLVQFPSWKDLVDRGIPAIEECIMPLGLYRQRAGRLYALALVMENLNGELPRDRASLESLPLFGQYITNAVELIVFKRQLPLLDVNMARVLERFFGPRKLADIRYDPYLQKLSMEVVRHPDSLSINWAILDFAAIVCTARLPLCLTCPLKKFCKYYRML
jgi:A/G-specific adenine glycosylase